MKIEAPITKVRLLEDRALVTRQFSRELESGMMELQIDAISPILSDKTLTARVVVGDGVVINECRVDRRQRAGSEMSEEETQRLQDRSLTLADELTILKSRLDAARLAEETSWGILDGWLYQSAEDIHWERGDSKQWAADLKELRKRHQSLLDNRLSLQAELEEMSEESGRVSQQLAERSTPSDEVEANLYLQLEVAEKCEVELLVEYVVPSACWRPCYLAEWTDNRLHFESQACVWQRTGEDWNDVELRFSTQRATLGTSPPKLSRDLLRLQKKQKQVVVQTREESVIVKHQKSEQMPGIDDGGEVVTLEANAKMSVESNGRPHRVPLASFSTPVKSEMVVMGELGACVFSNSKQKNTGEIPLLPGPVDLVRSNGLVGLTYLDHISPGEEFRLSWGADPEVSVHRETEEGKVKASKVSSWKTTPHTVKIRLRNQTTEIKEFTVRERIPVSELKEVKIVQHPKKTTDGVTADENGFLSWNVSLGAHEQKTIELHYEVEQKKKVVEA